MGRKKYQIGDVVIYKPVDQSTCITHITKIEPPMQFSGVNPIRLDGFYNRVGRKHINPATPEQVLRYKLIHNQKVKLSEL